MASVSVIRMISPRAPWMLRVPGARPDRGVSVTKIFARVKPREPGLLLAHRSRPPGFSGHEPLHAGYFRGAHVRVLAFPHPDDREGSPDGREIEVAKK